MLWNAADEFQKASDAHFELERIYSAAMDFSKNDLIAEEIINEIQELLL